MSSETAAQEENIMKRFHVHVAVNDLDESVRFYSKMFGATPTVRKPDYAKWMVDDPRINFAISSRGARPGVNHLGFQVESDEELKGMRDRLSDADARLVEEDAAHCCYATSDKYWVTDPQGIAWETYHTLGSIPVFSAEPAPRQARAAAGCCTPGDTEDAKVRVQAKRGCCA
jgi:catechol 2,3-dioxygenase-like lactoylglutathione lyase family enzyme